MKSDVIIVLGGGISDKGSLSIQSQLRVKKAVELYNKKVTNKLLVSGRWTFIVKRQPSKTEAKAMKDFAVSLGVPREDVLIEDQSEDTIGNAYFTKKNFLKPRSWRKATIVTSDFHIKRTKYIFRKILGDYARIGFVSVKSQLPKKQFLKRMKREEATLEFTKNLFAGIPLGDDKAIFYLLKKEHPAYSRNPKYSKKEIIKLLDL